jgi:cytochrome-b5 reductase
VLLKNEFDELKKSHPGRLQVVYTVSKGEEKAGYRKGYITRELLKDVLPRNDTEDTEERMKVFVCGPPGLEESVAGKKGFLGFGATGGILGELGYDKGMVHRF